jgi:hypothetical protein
MRGVDKVKLEVRQVVTFCKKAGSTKLGFEIKCG